MKIAITKGGDVLHITMRGDFNESLDSHLSALSQKIETGSVLFDAEKVEFINSLGARQWIGFMFGLGKRQVLCAFEKCSPSFVEACNLYPKFAPSKSLKSVMMPIQCGCGYEGNALLTESQWSQSDVMKGVTCPKCGSLPRASVDPDEYLQCVKDSD